MDLLITNLQYVFLRLAVTGPLVKFAIKYIPYYVAVVLMAQLSFCYDLIIFYIIFRSLKPPIVNQTNVIVAMNM